jgi:hypothetical protein
LTTNASADYAPWLWLLLGLFIVRVIAQPLSLVIDSQLLPPFESWHGGVLPYPLLLAAQLLIIAWFARTAWRFGNGDVVPRYRLGVWMLVLGSVYFLTMLSRLFLGLAVLRESRWFSAYLPTAFHLVLATWLLLYGHFHFRYGVRGGDRAATQT